MEAFHSDIRIHLREIRLSVMTTEGLYPEKRGAQNIRAPFAQPTIINSEGMATRAWPETQMLFNLN